MDDTILWADENQVTDDHPIQGFYYDQLLQWYLVLDFGPVNPLEEDIILRASMAEEEEDDIEPAMKVEDRRLCFRSRRLAGFEFGWH
jgi:hypothetical protein